AGAAGAGPGGGTAGGEAAPRDGRQRLHRVVVARRAGARSRGLGHRPVQLERVAAGAAAVLVAGHGPSLTAGGGTAIPPHPGGRVAAPSRGGGGKARSVRDHGRGTGYGRDPVLAVETVAAQPQDQ